jgi:UDP-glucose 4-epimerase
MHGTNATSEEARMLVEGSRESSSPTLTGKSVLVTGGAGFIGSHLVERIAREGPSNLVVVDNLFLGRDDNLREARELFPSLKLHRRDASDYDVMGSIMTTEQTDVVFNLAIVPLPTSLVNPRWTVDVNMALTTVACELLRQGFYKTLIHFSSSETYGSASYVPMDEGHPGNPSTPYAASKLGADHVVLTYRETYGIDAAILRPFNNYGPRQNAGAYAGVIPIVIGRAFRGEQIEINGDGEQTRDFVFVRDTAEAAIRMFETPASRGKIINVGSGQETSINSLVRILLDAAGADVSIVHRPARPGDVRRHCASTTLCQEILKFIPSTDQHVGMAETVAWYRSQFDPGPTAS